MRPLRLKAALIIGGIRHGYLIAFIVGVRVGALSDYHLRVVGIVRFLQRARLLSFDAVFRLEAGGKKND